MCVDVDSKNPYVCSWCNKGLSDAKDKTLHSVRDEGKFACIECIDKLPMFLVPNNPRASVEGIVRRHHARGYTVPWCPECSLPTLDFGLNAQLAPKLRALSCWNCGEQSLRMLERAELLDYWDLPNVDEDMSILSRLDFSGV